MLNKLFALIVRGGITFGIGIVILLILQDGFNFDTEISILIASPFWLFGTIYTLLKFNQPFNINVLEEADNKIHSTIDDQSKKKIEEDMLRVKNLFDSEILTKEEYKQKIKVLKDKYL